MEAAQATVDVAMEQESAGTFWLDLQKERSTNTCLMFQTTQERLPLYLGSRGECIVLRQAELTRTTWGIPPKKRKK